MLVFMCKDDGIQPLFLSRQEFGAKGPDGGRRSQVTLFCVYLLVGRLIAYEINNNGYIL